jgi:hypothetical protein
MGQSLGLADAGCRVAGGFFDHAVDPLEDHPFVGAGDESCPPSRVKLIFT